MSIEYAVWLGEHALATVLWVAGPMLAAALIVGTLVSIFQTVTHLQEATLVFIPKILSVYVVLALLGGWMLQVLVGFATEMFISISQTQT
jgi:flagellar biosynthetic protein FliQ